MRSIAIYLQVLLRTHADAPPLRAFLEFPDAVAPTSAANTTSAIASAATTAAVAAGAASSASTVTGEQTSATSTPRDRDQGGAEVEDAVATTNGSSNEEQVQQQQPKPNEEEAQGGGAGGGEGGEKEKFRRLWTTLRVKLKPREIGIRCRLFEGVISGSEITDWLREQNHCSVLQACAIGQKLIQLGLLVTVTNGYYMFEDDEGGVGVGGNGGDGDEETAAASSMSFSFSKHSMQNVSALLAAATSSATSNTVTTQQQQDDFFSNASSHLYKFGKPSSAASSSSSSSSSFSLSMRSPSFSAASSHSLFGSRISANISHWVREGGMGGSGGRDSFSAPPATGTGAEGIIGTDEGVFQVVAGDSAGSEAAYGGGSIKGGYIEYVCRISHGGDEWSVNRRFREFEALSANLSKAGVRTTGIMPSKTGLAKKITTIVSASSGDDVETLEERRRGLEAFLTQTMIDVVEAKSEEAALVLARFLDDQHDKLAIH